MGTTTIKQKVGEFFARKDPNVSPFKNQLFITMRVEDLDKKFAL
jgi:DNA mismatch repair protein MutL